MIGLEEIRKYVHEYYPVIFITNINSAKKVVRSLSVIVPIYVTEDGSDKCLLIFPKHYNFLSAN